MKERKTLKEVYSQHEDAIQIAILVILAIALFISGYLVSLNFLWKPLNDSQFELCEQVARDVYAQKENVIVEAPENFYVNTTTTTITVKLADARYRGMVIAKLQNGELVMTRYMVTGIAVFISILMGIVCIAGTFCIFAIAYGIYVKIKM